MMKEEKYVIVGLCANIIAHAEMYQENIEVKQLIHGIIASHEKRVLNNQIRELMGEYRKIEQQYRKGSKEIAKRYEEICRERERLYERMLEVKGKEKEIQLFTNISGLIDNC